MPDVGELVSRLASLQADLVAALQQEYFCDDVEPPPVAFGWNEQQLRHFFETGGGAEEPSSELQPVGLQESVGSSKLQPVVPQQSVERLPGRPAILLLGDAVTAFAHHSLTADAVKNEKSPPLAGELLREEGPAEAVVEAGPGWGSLLARDYQWRCAADVINRGLSGNTTRLQRSDLPALLASLPVSQLTDVVAVTLGFGGTDSAAGAQHVSPAEFADNLRWILEQLSVALVGRIGGRTRAVSCTWPCSWPIRDALPLTAHCPPSQPNAQLIVMTPPPVIDTKWSDTAGRLGLSGGGQSRGLQKLKPFVEAAAKVCKAAVSAGLSCSLLDVYRDTMSRLMQFNDALAATGIHLSSKGNSACDDIWAPRSRSARSHTPLPFSFSRYDRLCLPLRQRPSDRYAVSRGASTRLRHGRCAVARSGISGWR